MQLPFLKKSEEKKNFFLALLFKPYKVGAILFEEINDKLFILASHEVETSKDTDDLSAEDLLHASDRAISFVETSLPADGTVEKTIFSVPYDWVVDGKIQKQYLDNLKKVCQDLGLVPVGFLTSIEAIVHFIEKNEGAPVSAIFLEIAKRHMYAYLVRGGKILEMANESVSDNIMTSSETLLKKLESVDVLPSKIILADYDGGESIQQQFLSHKWPRDIPFLHVPQVVTLEKGFENEATINGVASQMELEVLANVKTVEEEVVPEDVLEEASAQEFGFAKDSDVAIEKAKKLENLEKLPEESSEDILNETESVKAAISAKSPRGKKEEPEISYFQEGDTPGQSEIEGDFQTTSKSQFPINIGNVFSGINFKKLKIPSFSFPSLPFLNNTSAGRPKLIAGLVIVIVVIVLFLFVYVNYLLHATVVIFTDKKAIDKSQDISFSQNPTGDNAIKLSATSEEVNGSETKNSSGTKDTGDHAKGSITIYNKNEGDKSFSKGTILVGPNNLEFQLLNDVKIASTSSFATSLSSADGKVEASNFGKEYNLPSGSNFTVKGFSSSDFIGKNGSAISGGTKTTSTVVSQKDIDDLLAQVISSLESDAMSKAKSGASTDTEIFPKSLTQDVSDKSYTKKVNDQAGSVGISATIKYSIGEYNKSDLSNFVENLSKSQVPGTYVLRKGDSTTDVNNIKISKDGSSATATLKVHAVYVPQIDPSQLAASLGGKSEKSSQNKIRSITGVTDVNISFSNKIPFLPAILPLNPKNINIEVKE